jgi:hypothetical protein
MAHFAKLFNIEPDFQVVVMLEASQEGTLTLVLEKTVVQKTQVQMLHDFETEPDALKFFDSYDEPRAKAFILHSAITLNDLTGKSRVEGTDFTKN